MDFGVARLGAAGQLDERADQRALAALAVRAHGRLSSLAAQRVLERAASADGAAPFTSVTSLIEAVKESPAPAPTPASPPPSLTQQFFAEGEAQEAAHAAAAVATDDDRDVEASSTSLARVPRNRAQIIATTALAVGAAAVMVGTVVSLSAAREWRPPAAVSVQNPADAPPSPPRGPAAAGREPTGAHRSRQGRTAAAARSRHVEPPQFVPSPVSASVPVELTPTPAPAGVAAAPAPDGVSAAPVPPGPAPVPAPPAPQLEASPPVDAPEPAPAAAAGGSAAQLDEIPPGSDSDGVPNDDQSEGAPPTP
jgi:hypothetical protein